VVVRFVYHLLYTVQVTQCSSAATLHISIAKHTNVLIHHDQR